MINIPKPMRDASEKLVEIVRTEHKALVFVAWAKEQTDDSLNLVFGFHSRAQTSLKAWYQNLSMCYQKLPAALQSKLSQLQLTVVMSTDKKFEKVFATIIDPEKASTLNRVVSSADAGEATLEISYLYMKGSKKQIKRTNLTTVIELKKTTTGKYYFLLVASNGQILLASSTYSKKINAEKAIESLRKNGVTRESYELLASSKGEYYFIAKAKNGAILAQSAMYQSEEIAESSVEFITQKVAHAPLSLKLID